MAKTQPGHRLAEALGLAGIEIPHALVEVDVAVGAGAGAARPHDQEGGGAAGKALADIRAAGLLAHRVELEIEEQVGHRPDPLALGCLHPQPVGLTAGGKPWP